MQMRRHTKNTPIQKFLPQPLLNCASDVTNIIYYRVGRQRIGREEIKIYTWCKINVTAKLLQNLDIT